MHACKSVCLIRSRSKKMPREQCILGMDVFFMRLFLIWCERNSLRCKMQWGYLIEFGVDDFGVFVPVVNVDPHL